MPIAFFFLIHHNSIQKQRFKTTRLVVQKMVILTRKYRLLKLNLQGDCVNYFDDILTSQNKYLPFQFLIWYHYSLFGYIFSASRWMHLIESSPKIFFKDQKTFKFETFRLTFLRLKT